MGNNTSNPVNNITVPKIKFGSVNNPEHSRPGYYSNGKIIKYHTNTINLLPGENVGSFKKLGYGYAITNKNVYYKGARILNVNPDNFRVINRNQVSSLGIPHVTKLNSVIGVSNNNIYHKGKLI